MAISDRIPRQNEIAPVYAVIVVLVYGWTILRFTYNLPGWLYFLNLGEIAGMLAYGMVVNLFESLLVLVGVIAIASVLPKQWFADAFIARGAALSILALLLTMVIAAQFWSRDGYPALIGWSPVFLVLIAWAVYFLDRIPRVRQIIEGLADRAVIFLYISIPLSIVSLIVVLFRLLF